MNGLPFVIAAIAALLTVSACDSHTSEQATPRAGTTTSASEPTLKEQADRYLAIVKPVNEASATFAAETTGRHAFTRKEWDSIANPFLAAIKQSNTALLRPDWSAPARPHIRSLVAADAAWIADFSRAYDAPDAGPPVVARDIAASRRAAKRRSRGSRTAACRAVQSKRSARVAWIGPEPMSYRWSASLYGETDPYTH
jgi:hypothetical protein